MRFPHVYSDSFWIILPVVCLLVWCFNAYRLGKFQGKKKVLPWVIGGVLLVTAVLFFLLTG